MDIEDKPKGWEETVNDLIRANFDYQYTNLALKKKFGAIGAIGGDVYRQMKEKITGGTKVDEKIDDLGTRKRVQKPKKLPVWNKQKQTQADSSKLAQIINMGVYQGMLPFCANQELKEEHVQEINPGGAIVANITYFFPESKLEHPLVMLGIRVVILYIKFKSVCGRIKEAKDNVVHVGKAGMGAGLKPGMKTDVRAK
jgi:hypothetical protein